MHFLVVGADGLVGTNVAATATQRGHNVTGTYHTADESPHADRHLNKTDTGAVQDVIDDVHPDAVVDAAAMTDVDGCETHRDRAWQVNAQGTRNVALAAADAGAHYVTLSTDYVFPGDPEETPYTEGDSVSPSGYYARTKYAGEQAARVADDWTVLRTSVVYGTERPNFATWVVGELEAGNEVHIVDDQVSTPTYAPDVARACVDVAEGRLTGLYHATGPRSISRYEFTLELADVYGFDRDLVNSTTTEALGQVAPRPTDGSLDSSHLYDELGWSFRGPRAAFEAMQSQE